MHILLAVFLILNTEKNVEVHFVNHAPKIDGIIEEVWQQADSAYNFVQHIPYEKTEPTEKTVVYVLQDENNLYVAFRCYAENHKPIACFTRDEDYVRVSIDPFGSKTTGYYFLVFASEIIWDGWVLDDGRIRDDSWEGVWYRATKLYDDRLEVEIKIPFKSIRYKKGLDEWRVQFMRHQAHNLEDDYWTEVSQTEGDLVSKWGSLSGIDAKATGYYFELFPEAYVRHDRDELLDSTKLKLSTSLNFKWDVTPQATVNATILPDFAQIESDPFILNLSRYPTYLDERRPFFLEGRDIFRLSDFSQNGPEFYQPLNIFYSRSIGKSLNGDVVPIIGGLKLTNKSEDWNIGTLGAYTDEYTDTLSGIDEPHRWFGVLRAKRRVFENSDIGMLFSGTMVNENNYNYSLGIDGVYRKGADQIIIQSAVSDRNEKKGWALSSGYRGFMLNLFTRAALEAVHDSFDVNDIGFVPWSGRKQLFLVSGPYKTYEKGFLRWLYVAPGINIIQEPGNDKWSILGRFEVNPQFRNNWGFALDFTAGRYYETDTNYFYRGVGFSMWGFIMGNNLNFGGNYSYTYNYFRNFLAYQGSNWFFFGYSIIPQMSIVLNGNLWIEWNPDNEIIAIWPMVRPRLDIRFTADMSLTVFNEFVMSIPETDFGESELLSNRFGFLFSWNFLPKSWFYVALNDYREQDLTGSLQPTYRIGAIKAKYLLYF
jgi:hypothetical protein